MDKVAVEIQFHYSGYYYSYKPEIRVSGSWDKWHSRCLMEDNNSSNIYKITLTIPPGQYIYKFIVNNKWQVDPTQPIMTNIDGDNNVITVNSYNQKARVKTPELSTRKKMEIDHYHKPSNENPAANDNENKQNSEPTPISSQIIESKNAQPEKEGGFSDYIPSILGGKKNKNKNTELKDNKGNSKQPTALQNNEANCFVNSAVQMLKILDIPWNEGSSQLSQLFGKFNLDQISQRDFMSSLSTILETSMSSGDVRTLVLSMLTDLSQTEKNSKVTNPLLFENPRSVIDCYNCLSRKVLEDNKKKNFIWLHGTKSSMQERIKDHFHCSPVQEMDCCTRGKKNQFQTTTYSKWPQYAIIATEKPVDIEEIIQFPGCSSPYMLVSYSMNSGSHCRAMVRKQDQWYLCDDQTIRPLPKDRALKQDEFNLLFFYSKM